MYIRYTDIKPVNKIKIGKQHDNENEKGQSTHSKGGRVK